MIEIATLITAIASFATALVALWSIRELKLSRSVASSPSLILKGQRFGAVCGEESPEFIGPTEKPSIVVINFGNGPAIELEVDWEIPNDKMINVLKSYDPHNEYQVEIGQSPFAEDPAIKLYWNHFIERQINEQLEPILPHPIADPTIIHLPPFYLEAFHLYLKLAVHNRQEKKIAFDIDSFPEAKFKLSYKDLAGEKYTKEFSLCLSYDHNSTHQIKKDNAYAANLQVNSENT